MPAQVIIKLIPDTSEMPRAEEALENIAGIDKATADQIRNTNKAFAERSQATDRAASSADKLAKASASLTQSITGGAINQVSANIDKLSKKLQEGGKGSDLFRQSIEAATQALAGMDAGSAEFNKLQGEITAATAAFEQLNGVAAATPTDRLKQLEATMAKLAQDGLQDTEVFAGLKAEFDQIANAVSNTSDDYKAYSQAIELAKEKLSTLSAEDPQFDKLTKEIQASELAMENFAQEATSSRGRLRQFRETLLQLEDAGLDGTQVFNDIAEAAGELEDQVGDTQARIKVLASDTFKFDVAIQAVQGVAGAFGVAQGAAALFGSENEDLQKALLKVNAAMSILSGLQAIQNILQKESALNIGATIALEKLQVVTTNLQAAAESKNIIVRYAAIAAQRILNATMAANPAGVVLFAIAALATALVAFTRDTDDAADAQARLNDGLKVGAELSEAFTKAIGDAGDVLVAQLQAQGAAESEIRAQRIKTLQDQLAEQKKVYDRNNENYAKVNEQFIALGKDATEKDAENRQKAYDLANDAAEKYFSTQKALEIANLNDITARNKEREQQQKDAQEKAKKAQDEAKKNLQAVLRDQVAAAENQLLNAKTNFDKLTAEIVLSNAKLKLALSNPDLGPNERLLAETKAGDDIRKAREKLFEDLTDIDTVAFSREEKRKKEFNRDVLKKEIQSGAEVAKARLEQNQKNAQDQIEADEKRIEQEAKTQQAIREAEFSLASSLASSLNEISRNSADYQLSVLQDQLDKGIISQEEYERKSKAIKIRQAQQEKQFALFQATINAAAAIVKVFETTAPPASFVLAAITAAATLAQIAAIQSKPIPAFRKGTKNAPGGLSLIGEAGPELFYSNGALGYAAGPTILDLPKGAKVVPTLETEKILSKYDIPLPQMGKTNTTLNSMGIDYKRLAHYVGKEVGSEISKMPVTVFGYDKNGPFEHVTSMQNRRKFLNKRFGRA